MGHTRLGAIPKTRKWNEVVKEIARSGPTDSVAPAIVSMGAIAAQTLDAAQKGLDRATDDPGVLYTFYLLTQVALAARTSDSVERQYDFRPHRRGAGCDRPLS
jgi:hypothetical protein